MKDKPAEDFAHSPLLTNPEQIKEILANAAPERLLAPAASANVEPAASKPTPQTLPPGESPEPPKKEVAAPKPPANPPPAKVPTGPVAKSVAPVTGKP